MEHYREKDNLNDQYESHIRPCKVIEETEDGWVEKDLDPGFSGSSSSTEWDMVCHSENGWWVMDSVTPKDVAAVVEGDKNEGKMNATKDDKEGVNIEDGNEDEEDKEDVEDEDGNEISADRQMFLSCYDVVQKENAYCGNDGGQRETWYYAAAIIISPIVIPRKKTIT